MLVGYTMSKHLKEERLDRLVAIGTTIGFGNVIKEAVHREATAMVTDTGVVYIVNKTQKFVITAYVATVDEIIAIYNGKNNIPSCLFAKVKKNSKINWG